MVTSPQSSVQMPHKPVPSTRIHFRLKRSAAIPQNGPLKVWRMMRMLLIVLRAA